MCHPSSYELFAVSTMDVTVPAEGVACKHPAHAQVCRDEIVPPPDTTPDATHALDDHELEMVQDFMEVESPAEPHPFAPFKSRQHLDLVLHVNHPRHAQSRQQAASLLAMLKASDSGGNYADLTLDDLYMTPVGPLAPQIEQSTYNNVHCYTAKLGKTVAQHLSLTRIRENLQFLPQLMPPGIEHTERSQSKFARENLSQPSALLNDTHFWVGQCVAFSSAGQDCFGRVLELVLSPFGDVMAIVAVCDDAGQSQGGTAVVFLSRATNHALPDCQEPPISLRLGIIIFSDETSGNGTKKWY